MIGRSEFCYAAEWQKEGKKSGVLAGVPKALPQLLRAYRLGERAAGQGFEPEAALAAPVACSSYNCTAFFTSSAVIRIPSGFILSPVSRRVW